MSIIEQKSFIKAIHPFEHLSSKELDNFAKSMDIAYFERQKVLQKSGSSPTHLYFIIKGFVHEKDEDEVVSFYTTGEIFNPISLIENYSKSEFIAHEETICYILPSEIFIQILRSNTKLKSYFFQSISEKLNRCVNDEKNQALSNIMLAKVKDTKIHKAFICQSDISIFEAASIIKEQKIPNLLLEDESKELYIVTDSDFRQKVILNRLDFDQKVSTIASKGLVYIYEDDFLFDAQLKMSKYALKRLVVKDKNEKIIGVLDQISLSSFFASNTFLISNQIEQASGVDELQDASGKFLSMIKSLHAKGVKIEFIAKLISQLNQKLLDKLFKLLAPKGLYENSALIIMGSEGRGEQVIKTDQDNGIIISDDFEIDESILREFAEKFTQTLVEFGFPKCDGNVMVSNPFWCKKSANFKEDIFNWLQKPDGHAQMNIAIFYDSSCVNGNDELLDELKEYLFKISNDTSSFYAHFARVVNSFDVPLGFFDGFTLISNDKTHKNELDLKRGGIFITLHCIRSLAMEYKIKETNTIARIKKLTEFKLFDEEFAKEIITAYSFLLNLKLQVQLDKLNHAKKLDNYIDPSTLSSMERDLLKDSFKIVNTLKKQIQHHFRLNYV